MLQSTFRAVVRVIPAAMLAVAGMLAVPTASHAQQVVVMVDGEPITALDIEQRTKFMTMSNGNKAPTRQEVLDGLIDEILQIKEGAKFGINVPTSEVDNSYASVATRMGVDSKKLTDILEKGGASEGTLKHRLKAQMVWNALIRGRYKASLEVADKDVETEIDLHKPQDKKEAGYEYVLRPIMLVVPRGSPDTAFEARKRDADALRLRFQNCSDGIPFTRALREVAVRDNVIKYSADLAPELRAILDSTDVGHLTPPEQTAEGIQMFALCSKNDAKNDTPGRKEMREELFQQKFGAKAKRYLAEIHREAMIEYKTTVIDQPSQTKPGAKSKSK